MVRVAIWIGLAGNIVQAYTVNRMETQKSTLPAQSIISLSKLVIFQYAASGIVFRTQQLR